MRPDAVQYARALRPPYHLLSFLRIKGKSTKGKSCTDKNTMVRRNVCSLKFLPSLHSKQISVSLAYELQPTLFYPIICSSWKDCSRIFFKLNSSVYWFTPLDCCLVSLTIGDFSQQLKKTLSVIYPIIYLLQFYSKMSTNLNDVSCRVPESLFELETCPCWQKQLLQRFDDQTLSVELGTLNCEEKVQI